jgi:hypothetical protein
MADQHLQDGQIIPRPPSPIQYTPPPTPASSTQNTSALAMLENTEQEICTEDQHARPTDYRDALTEGQISHSHEPAIVPRKFWINVRHGTSPRYEMRQLNSAMWRRVPWTAAPSRPSKARPCVRPSVPPSRLRCGEPRHGLQAAGFAVIVTPRGPPRVVPKGGAERVSRHPLVCAP